MHSSKKRAWPASQELRLESTAKDTFVSASQTPWKTWRERSNGLRDGLGSIFEGFTTKSRSHTKVSIEDEIQWQHARNLRRRHGQIFRDMDCQGARRACSRGSGL